MSATISRDQWVKALGDAVAPVDPDAFTITELAKMFGVGRSSMENRINKLSAAGRVHRTVKITHDINGHAKRVTAFKLIDAPAPAKAKRRR